MDKLAFQKLYLFPFIKNLNDYNIVLKYSLQELIKNKAIISNKGYLYSFRWSKDFNEFVLDRNTSNFRDIKGLRFCDEMPEQCMNSILSSLNESKVNLKKVNLLNENKLIVFEINNLEYNFIGIVKRSFRGKKTKALANINKFMIYDLSLDLNHVLKSKLNINKHISKTEVFKQSHRKLYELVCNSTLILNGDSKKISEVLFENKSVNSYEDLYFKIVKQIENNLLDIIKQDKIIYKHDNNLVSISRIEIKDYIEEEKEVELLPPLGIFTI